MGKTAVFYMATQPGAGRCPVVATGPDQRLRCVYVRMEVFDGIEVGEALDCANPREDEHVMNSHPIEER